MAPAGRELAGSIVDELERPVPGVSLTLRQSSSRVRATSDAQGRFRFTQLGDGVCTLWVEPGPVERLAGDGRVLARQTLEGIEAGASELRIVLQPAAYVRGRVLDAEGKPVLGAEVRLLGADGSVVDLAQSDAAGSFAFRARADASFELLVEAPGSLPLDVQIDRLRTQPQSPAEPVGSVRASGVVPGGPELELRLP